MMSFHDIIVKRRSIRRYTGDPISAEDVQTIIEAGLLAPSSKNQRSCRFIAVDDPDTIGKLAQCKPAGATPLNNCALAIVVGADKSVSEPWIEDASIAATLMQVQITALDLGSCWIQVRGRQHSDDTSAEDYIRDLLGIPENIGIVCVLSIGHSAEERPLQNVDKLCWDHVHIESWKPEQ